MVDIIHASEEAGFRYLSVTDVKGLLQALSAKEQTKQTKLEVFCEDDQAERAVQLIRQHGRTGQNRSWLGLPKHGGPGLRIDGRGD